MSVLSAKRIRKRSVCAILVALALVFVSFFVPTPAAKAETDGMIRVKLTRLGAPNAIRMTADCDYYLAADPSVRIAAGETMTIAASGSQLTLTTGGTARTLGESARLMRATPGNYGVRFLQPELSNRFCGDLGFAASGGVITTVLNIYIENYLYGVVGYEMPPSSGIEALKAQAVAARTYALRKKATRAGSAYDVTDTTADQVFKGYSAASEYANVIQAVDATRGGVLYYGNSLAQCYYSASNGGQTESTRNAWGTTLPYTVVKDDPYDFESASAVVRTAVINKDGTGLNASLKDALVADMAFQLEGLNLSASASDVRVNYIESITACDSRFAAPSRLYKSLTFKINVTTRDASGAPKTGTLSVSIPTYGAFETWYNLSINSADNETVWVTETDKTFIVSFRRFGHGIGLSQRGAQVMAGTYGKRVAEILEFYYPGTTGRQLALADTTRDQRTVQPQPEQTAIATARLSEKTDLLNAASDGAAVNATVAAGAVVDVYAVQDEWAAVGSSGKYGFVRTDALTSFNLVGSTVVRAEGEVYGQVSQAASVLQLPVAQAKVIGVVEALDRVRAYAWTDAWMLIGAPDGTMGFVPVGTVALEIVEAQPTPEPTPQPASADQVVRPDNLYGQLSEDTLLYAAGSAASAVLGTLYRGTVVKVVAYNQAWAFVNTQDGQAGYVALSSISALDMAQINGVSGDDAADAMEIDGGAITRVDGERYMYVQAESAEVHADWSLDSEIVARLYRGDRVLVGAYNAKWACVAANGGTGYVLMSELSDAAPANIEGGEITRAEANTYAAAARDGVAVYRSYSKDSDQIATLYKGQKVLVGAYNTLWAMVSIEGAVGYVPMTDLVAAEPESADGVVYQELNALVIREAKLYGEAREGAAVLTTIPEGSVVYVRAWNSAYALVDYNGMRGFVKLECLDRN